MPSRGERDIQKVVLPDPRSSLGDGNIYKQHASGIWGADAGRGPGFGSEQARLQYDEFIATSGNNNEFISARASQIDLIGTGVGKSAAKGPGA